MRLEFLLIYKQAGPSKTEIIAKKINFSKKDINKSRKNFRTKITKKNYLKVGQCVYIGEFFCADKKHPGQPKKKSNPNRPPPEVLKKLHFFTLSSFSSISRLSRHNMKLQLSNPSI